MDWSQWLAPDNVFAVFVAGYLLTRMETTLRRQADILAGLAGIIQKCKGGNKSNDNG